MKLPPEDIWGQSPVSDHRRQSGGESVSGGEFSEPPRRGPSYTGRIGESVLQPQGNSQTYPGRPQNGSGKLTAPVGPEASCDQHTAHQPQKRHCYFNRSIVCVVSEVGQRTLSPAYDFP